MQYATPKIEGGAFAPPSIFVLEIWISRHQLTSLHEQRLAYPNRNTY